MFPTGRCRNTVARFDDMGRQERLRKVFQIQRYDEISSASFSARAEGIVSRIGRDVGKSGNRDEFRLLSQQIDYPSDEWTPDAQPCQDPFVFQKNLIVYQPDKRISLDPVP